MDKIAQLRDILAASRRAVFFGGAGMSTESGIPDFRSAGGIYSESLHKEYTPEQMASNIRRSSSIFIDPALSTSRQSRTPDIMRSRSWSAAAILPPL